jgi:hypothetical protein
MSSFLSRWQPLLREYGRVALGVHVVNSLFWYSGSFYCCHSYGDDAVRIIAKRFGIEAALPGGTVGEAALAYAVYKGLTPVRWPITIVATPVVAAMMRGKAPAAAASVVSHAQKGSCTKPARRPPPGQASQRTDRAG